MQGEKTPCKQKPTLDSSHCRLPRSSNYKTHISHRTTPRVPHITQIDHTITESEGPATPRGCRADCGSARALAFTEKDRARRGKKTEHARQPDVATQVLPEQHLPPFPHVARTHFGFASRRIEKDRARIKRKEQPCRGDLPPPRAAHTRKAHGTVATTHQAVRDSARARSDAHQVGGIRLPPGPGLYHWFKRPAVR